MLDTYAKQLAEYILTMDRNFTVGVYGQWGSGKNELRASGANLSRRQSALHRVNRMAISNIRRTLESVDSPNRAPSLQRGRGIMAATVETGGPSGEAMA